MTRPTIPERIGRYQLLEILGEGGMGQVWKAVRRDENTGVEKIVAIKFVANDSATKSDYNRMFLREARVSTLLNHSSIAQVFEAGVEDEQLFMAMEYIHGLNVDELIKLRGEELLSFEIIAHIIGEVLLALAYAHDFDYEGQRLSVIHRDVSPHNIMVSASGDVKVMDFGVASLSGETTTGNVKGKVQYMPKEQLLGSSRHPTTDLYAVGGVLHELLELKPFRHAQESAQVIGMILDGTTPELTREGVPPELAELRARLLEPDVSDRVQTAKEARLLLSKWPGYRNVSLELGELVGRLRRQQAREHERPDQRALKYRVDTHDEAAMWADTLQPQELESEREPRESAIVTVPSTEPQIPTQAVARRDVGPSVDMADARQHLRTTVERDNRGILHGDESSSRPAPWARRLLVGCLGAGLLGLFVVFYLRTFVHSPEDSAVSERDDVADPAGTVTSDGRESEDGDGDDVEDEDEVEIVEHEREGDPTDAQRGGGEETGMEMETGGAMETGAETETAPEVPTEPGVVLVHLSEFFCVEGHVGGKSFRLEGTKRRKVLKLPAGSYVVRYGACGADEDRAGRLEVGSGQRIHLYTHDPPRLD